MKTLAIATLTALSFTAFAAEPAKAPAGTQNRVEATAPAKAEAPKEEMKLAKKKDAPKADATKSPVKDEKATATTAPKADAKPAK